MMGKQSGQIQMVILDIDFMIPEDHLLRRIKKGLYPSISFRILSIRALISFVCLLVSVMVVSISKVSVLFVGSLKSEPSKANNRYPLNSRCLSQRLIIVLNIKFNASYLILLRCCTNAETETVSSA